MTRQAHLRLPYGLLEIRPLLWIRVIAVVDTLHILEFVEDGIANTWWPHVNIHLFTRNHPSTQLPEKSMPTTKTRVAVLPIDAADEVFGLLGIN